MFLFVLLCCWDYIFGHSSFHFILIFSTLCLCNYFSILNNLIFLPIFLQLYFAHSDIIFLYGILYIILMLFSTLPLSVMQLSSSILLLLLHTHTLLAFFLKQLLVIDMFSNWEGNNSFTHISTPLCSFKTINLIAYLLLFLSFTLLVGDRINYLQKNVAQV